MIGREAVYAVIECKQDVSRKNIEYAAKKARSVRALKRSPGLPITHAGGTYPPKQHHNILAGLVCVGGNLPAASRRQLEMLKSAECQNFLCSLSGTFFRLPGFDPWKKNTPPHPSEVVDGKLSLVTFVVNLIAELQAIGTVPAIDIRKYLQSL